jgi:hypothetical protein
MWAINLFFLNLPTFANTKPDRTQRISFRFVCPELLFCFLKLVMCNMSNEQRVTPTEMYFLYSAIYNLWLLIHYSSVRSGRSSVANSRGKFTGTREIISALVAIWKTNQGTYQVSFSWLSQGLALHHSTDPVPMTYTLHVTSLWDGEPDLLFRYFRWLTEVVKHHKQVLIVPDPPPPMKMENKICKKRRRGLFRE